MLTSNRFYAKRISFDKSSSMKLTTYQKLRNSNGNTFSFIPHVCYSSYHPWIATSEGRSLTTEEQQHPCPILLEFPSLLPSPLLCKNHKKPEVYKKIQACETVTLTESFIISACRCSKRSVSRLLTLVRTLYSVGFCFQICSGNNNKSLLLYACEVIHLINKGVISQYI